MNVLFENELKQEAFCFMLLIITTFMKKLFQTLVKVGPDG